MVKTVFDAKTGELLGAHMIGAEVTELIQGLWRRQTSLETTEARPDAHRLPASNPLGDDARVGAWTPTDKRGPLLGS